MKQRLFNRAALCMSVTLMLAACGGADPTESTAQAEQERAQAQAVNIGNAKTVIINEVMAANFFGITDEDADVEDWAELYNSSSAAVDLSGWGLSNKTASPFRWVFPQGTSMPARGYLRVWLSKKDRTTSTARLHANFNLDNGADTLLLSAPNATQTGVLMDQVVLPLQQRDVSFCRMPNGSPSAAFAHCLTPTPAAANSGTAQAAMLAKPALSLASGVYASSQSVTVTGPASAELRYTRDGSEPVATSPLVVGAITVSANTTLRVAAFQAGSVRSLVETATYVIDTAGRFAGQRVAFLTMSPADMANYKAGGRPAKGWPAHLAITAPDTGAILFSANAQGSDSGQIGSRQGQNNTPIDIKFKDALGDKEVTAPLFPTKPGIPRFKHLKLRNSGDDYWYAHIRDGYWQSLLDEKVAPGAAQEPVQVFTNGTYYGMMDLREKEDETLAEATYGVDKDFVQYLNDGKVLGGFNTTADYNTMRTYILGNSMAVAANYDRARSLLHMETFAQDFALHMFAADRDWLWRNMHVFRMPAYDGLWRFRPHDFDISAGGTNSWGYDSTVGTNMNNLYGNYDGGAFMNALLNNPNFRNLYINVIADQLNSTLSVANLNARLDAMATSMQPYMATHWALTPTSRGASLAQWSNQITVLRNFLNQREALYDQHTRTKFGLTARKSLSVSVNDPTMGTVKVNTVSLASRLSATTPTWTGKYYPEVPVTLLAQPAPGYTFVGWQGGSTAATASISASVAVDGVSYQAVFAPVATVAAPVLGPMVAQTLLTGDLVNMNVVASDPTGHTLTWSAKKLPSGLDIHPETGRIFGKATRGGAFASSITVSNGKASTTISVPWTVNNRGDRVANLPQDIVGDGIGLAASYFNNNALTGTPLISRTELPALALGAGAGPATGFGTSNWSVRWEGYLESPLAGAHSLRAVINSNDAVRVYVGGTLVIDNWTQPSTVARQTGAVTLAANTKTAIRIEFMDPTAAANLQMQWQLPGGTAYAAMPLAVFSTLP